MNILFVHGLYGFLHEQDRIKIFLQKHDHVTSFEFNYREKLGQMALEVIAKRCGEIIRKNNIDLVIGLSMGGVIAAHGLEHAKTNCKKCVTICAPWNGSKMARLFNFNYFKGIGELEPTSKFLKDLRKKAKNSDINYYVAYNPLDLMVFPGSNAKVPFAKKTVSIPVLTHYATFFTKKSVELCEYALLDKK